MNAYARIFMVHSRSALTAITTLTAIAFIALSGCASTHARVTRLGPVISSIRELDLAGIELESIYSYTRTLAEIEAVIVSSAQANGIAINPRVRKSQDDAEITGSDSTKRYAISIFIREQGYAKGFRTTLSLAIIADIRDIDGKPVMRAEWFHDGEESFDSLWYLASSLDTTFKKVSKAMRKSE